MCGISVIYSLSKAPCATSIKKMNDIIHHRGPDDEGYTVWDGNTIMHFRGGDTPQDLNALITEDIDDAKECLGNVFLGHRRLSILDLSHTGHQPMAYLSDRYIITFNGEIYNYLELKVELSKSGYQFSSNTDTEVIIAAYDLWGTDCLTKFNGMFSFVILDTRDKILFGARDRFGIKPMYYHLSNTNTLYVASEIKQLVPFIDEGPELNEARAYDYLVWAQTDHTNETMFKNVFQVLPGCFFLLKENSISLEKNIHRYYNLAEQIERKRISYTDSVRVYRDLFMNAVKLRMRSDVPIGTCLSGGMDSSSVLGTILSSSNQKTLTFSNCAYNKTYDEQEYIDLFKGYTQVEQHKIYPNLDGLLEDLTKIIYQHDEPFLSTSVFAEWSVFSLVKTNGIKVTLDGHGADEQLIGYTAFLPSLLGTYVRDGNWWSLMQEIFYAKKLHNLSSVELLKKIFISILPAKISLFLLKVTNRIDATPRWLSLNHEAFKGLYVDRLNENIRNRIEVNVYNQIVRTSVPKQLKWSDRDSMTYGVESRVPFLDHNLVEFTLGLPIQYRYRKGVTKSILRDAMIGIVPEKILNRHNKLGYVTPEKEWFMNEDKDKIMELLKEAVYYSRGVFDNGLITYAEGVLSGKRRFSKLIWRTICFGQWMKIYQVKN